MEKQNDRKKRILFLLILGVTVGLILLLIMECKFLLLRLLKEEY